MVKPVGRFRGPEFSSHGPRWSENDRPIGLVNIAIQSEIRKDPPSAIARVNHGIFIDSIDFL